MPDSNQLIQEKLSSLHFYEVWILTSSTKQIKVPVDKKNPKGEQMPVLTWSCEMKWRDYGDTLYHAKSGYLYQEFDMDEFDSSLLEDLENTGFANENQFTWIDTLFSEVKENSFY